MASADVVSGLMKIVKDSENILERISGDSTNEEFMTFYQIREDNIKILRKMGADYKLN